MFSKRITPILIFIGAIVVLLIFVKKYEGFDGTVPTNADTSSIPVATPGANTADPTNTPSNASDILALKTLVSDLKTELAKNPELTGIPEDKKPALNFAKQNLPNLEKELDGFLGDVSKTNKLYVDRTTNDIKMMIEALRNVPGSTAAPAAPAAPEAPTVDVKEVQRALDALKALRSAMLRKDPLKTNMPTNIRNNIVMLRPRFPAMENRLNAALADPSKSTFTTEEVVRLSLEYENSKKWLDDAVLQSTIQQQKVEEAKSYQEVVNANAADAKATTVAGPVTIITKQQLLNLQARITSEIRRISNLRSRSATMITRKTQLEKLLADLTDIIQSVDRKALKLEDVPIQPQDADNFLKAMASGKNLPSLIVPKGKTPAVIQGKGAAFPAMTPEIQQLLERAQYLKWDLEVKLSYDPKLAIQDRALKLLESLEKKLTAAAVSDTPIPPQLHAEYMSQLSQLQTSLDKKSEKSRPSGSSNGRLPTTHSRIMNASSAEYPDNTQLLNAQGAHSGPRNTFPNGEISPDVYIRPGFVMNDETIARRASSSAFDPSVVGGPDYKKRALDLCKQVKSAQLGDPESFGCIDSPDAVSSSYSWKGNYQMVCNRLGDTWGGWYPEMFGCPKYDPTDKFRGTMM